MLEREKKVSRPLFEDLLDVYFRLILAGVEPARARRIMDLYLA